MSIEVIDIIGNAMSALKLNYGFGEYLVGEGGAIPPLYFVGSYIETETFTEDGLCESTFIITGFSRGSWLELEEAKEKIEKHFNRVTGIGGITSSGSAVAIFYAHSLIVPTGDAELKSIQINLSVKEWKVT